MSLPAEKLIVLENVSRFYGDVLGVNRVSLSIPPGITSLVGPNGSGKTTLMNLMTGLVRPTEGKISVLGMPPTDPRRMFHTVARLEKTQVRKKEKQVERRKASSKYIF